jgi:hypothetical protein
MSTIDCIVAFHRLSKRRKDVNSGCTWSWCVDLHRYPEGRNTLVSSAVAEIVDCGARMDTDGVGTATGDNGVGFTLMLPPRNFVEQVVCVTKQMLVSCAAVVSGTLAGVEFTGT